jgi:hypothetical protein
MENTIEEQQPSITDNTTVTEKPIKEVFTKTVEVVVTTKYLLQERHTTYADGSKEQTKQYSSHTGVTVDRDDLTESY